MDFAVISGLLADCAPPQDLSIFHPVSPSGTAIRSLSYLVLGITGGILLVVGSVLMYCVIRFRSKQLEGREPPQVYGSIPIEIAWTAAPMMVVFVLLLVTTRTLWEVEVKPPEPKAGDETLFVTVIGRQWWWEYRYDYYDGKELNFTTANELHMPVSADGTPRPVYLTLKSADVCHSFWVPRLAGKTDLIPGRVNSMWLQTDQEGTYLGQCAEYCGTQHANMLLRVVVEPPEKFATWLAHEGAPAIEADPVRMGREKFESLSCVNCHAVRGTLAVGTYGPDLTHLMSRETLAAGMVPNTREELRRWIENPQSVKPGCLMPAFGLSERDLDAVVSYLETLR
ncbi:MAG TPA: cytochrome c oxidase subunit II [Pirellulaceae bacterium]|nr:cytochrome c oxidase subunit II [Pirellulaceae bacterium]